MFSKDYICSNCGMTGLPVNASKGSVLTEVLLWACFVLPGIFYSIWRTETRHKVCRECRSKDIYPVNSFIGRQIYREYEKTELRYVPTDKPVDIIVHC